MGEQLQKSEAYFRRIAGELRNQSEDSAGRAARLLAIRQEFETLNVSALKDLDSLDRKSIDAKLLGRMDSVRAELGKAQAFLRSADQNLALGRNVAALGRNLGAVVGAADILVKLKNPNLSSYEFAESGVGFIGGVIGGSLGLLVPLPGSTVAAGVIGSVYAKYLWQKYVAPEMGWSEKDSPRFWDSVFEALGLGHRPEKPTITRPAVDDVPLRLIMAQLNNYPYPPFTHVGRLSLKSRDQERAEYTLFDIDKELLIGKIDAAVPGAVTDRDKEQMARTIRLLDEHRDGRLDASDRLFRFLALWRDKPELGVYGFDEIEWVTEGDVIWIDPSTASLEVDHASDRQPAKTAEPVDLKAIEARHGDSFTRYFDDLLGGPGVDGRDDDGGADGDERDGNRASSPRTLPTLKATFERALEKDPAVGLADLIDFATLVGPGTLRAQGWDPRPMIVAGLRNGVLPAGMGSAVQDADGGRAGSARDDILFGTEGADLIRGAGGEDVLGGGAGVDQLFGDGDDDQLSGGQGSDVLHGGDGDDELIGDQGADTLMGGPGNDRLRGNVGDDVLIGGPGDDVLIGGSGADTFRFERGGGKDRVLDQRNKRPNRLEFDAGLAVADVVVIRSGNELHLSWESGESVALARYFTRRSGRFDLHFADGASIEDARLRNWASTISGDAARLIDAMALVDDALTTAGEVATARPRQLSPMSMLSGVTA